MIKGITQKEYDEWLEYCKYVQQATSHKLYEKRHEREERKTYLLKPENYGEFFQYYYAHYCNDGKTKCSRHQRRNALLLHQNLIITLMQIWHRRSAKSTHANLGYPTHLMFNGELMFGGVMGFNEPKAARLLKSLQAELSKNQRIINDFGVQYSHGDWAKGGFSTTGGVAYESMSYIQDPAGMSNGPHRFDYWSIDDIDNRKKARNPTLVEEAVDNIINNAKAAMDKEKQRMVISNNRKVKNGVIDTIISEIGKKPDTKISLVNAVDKKGNSTWPENYSKAYWKRIKANATYKYWEREYMNNPVEAGKLFKKKHIQWKNPLPYHEYDALVLYGDLSYTSDGDLKSMHLVGKKGRELHILEAFNRQVDITEASKWLYDLYEDYLHQFNITYMLEGNFAQSMFVNDFDEEGDERDFYIDILPDKRQKGEKYDRIEKRVLPPFVRLRVFFNKKYKGQPDWDMLEDCLLGFQRGSGVPDDPPDSLEGAFYQIALASINNIDKIRLIDQDLNFVD